MQHAVSQSIGLANGSSTLSRGYGSWWVETQGKDSMMRSRWPHWVHRRTSICAACSIALDRTGSRHRKVCGTAPYPTLLDLLQANTPQKQVNHHGLAQPPHKDSSASFCIASCCMLGTIIIALIRPCNTARDETVTAAPVLLINKVTEGTIAWSLIRCWLLQD